MDFKRLLWIGVVLVLPLSVVAKPAYLKCKLDGNDGSFIVTVDEELGRVTMPTGPVYDKAQFTAEEINFEKTKQSRSFYERDEYSINRSTLAFKSTWTHWSSVDGQKKESTSTGQCEVTKPPERKI